MQKQMQEQGYLILKNAVPDFQVEALIEAADSIVADFDIGANRSIFTTTDGDLGRDKYFMESAEAVHCFLEEDALDSAGELLKPRHQAINKIGHALHDITPVFTEFCRSDFISILFRQLGYIAPKLWQTMYIFKQPEIGGEVRWHQDSSYLNCGAARLTGFWLALEDATLDNGCLWLSPGGHHSPLREIYQVDHDSNEGALITLDDTPWPSEGEAVPAEVSRGTVILFDGFMPHYSSPNQSSRSRQALTLHVTEADAPWSADNWLQRRTLPDFLL